MNRLSDDEIKVLMYLTGKNSYVPDQTISVRLRISLVKLRKLLNSNSPLRSFGFIESIEHAHKGTILSRVTPTGRRYLSSIIRKSKKKSVEITKRIQEKKEKERPIVAVAMFDLPSSTQLKLDLGHSEGTRIAMKHNHTCQNIAKKYGGNTIKQLGDGIIIEFEDPLKACAAALEIKELTTRDDEFSTKAGITYGKVEVKDIGGIRDILGTTVDRCFRICSIAVPNQILVDNILYKPIESFIRDDATISVSKPNIFLAKGLGKIELFELSTQKIGLEGFKIVHFTIIEDGRLPLQEKTLFIEDAMEEIIEFGLGLSSFSDYFERRSPPEFKDKIIELLKRDVIIKCVLLNPKGEIVRIYLNDNEEPEYRIRIESSLKNLIQIKQEFSSQGLNGFKIFLYDVLPRFHATCVDLNTTSGKMSISHYLRGIKRAATPVMQFSIFSNPRIFELYKTSINNILKISKEINKKQ